ncbi:alpha/beta fold hydrolase [Arsenophonus nasoniae]|uniref:alpha/beta fold hydrolase n=1 Tax=Arsenophonus nasoniae TaxID=638 RepID=UPI0031455341
MAGHSLQAEFSTSHADCVDSIVEYVRQHDLKDLVVLGHSFGGTNVQRLAEIEAPRIKHLVFHNAFILGDGESLFDTLPPRYHKIWQKITIDKKIMLPFAIFRELFIGDAELKKAKQVYDNFLTSSCAASHYDKVPLKTFASLIIPRSIIYASTDNALPAGEYGWHPKFSDRLKFYRFISLPGSHEILFNNPQKLAKCIIHASRP